MFDVECETPKKVNAVSAGEDKLSKEARGGEASKLLKAEQGR